MSDYLSNLAARSIGQADVVRPRPVPIFAPPPRSASWPLVVQADDRDDLEVHDYEQQPVDPRTPVFRPNAQHADLHAPPPPMMPSFAPTNGWSQPAPSLVTSEAQHWQKPEPASERVIVERLIAPAAPAERVIIERPIDFAPARAATHTETTIESVVERIITPGVQPAPATVVPQVQPLPPAPIIVKPRLVPAPPAPAPPSAAIQPAPALPEPAPIIQVTIGRIEVRATPPSAQPARAARAGGPAMSLDEYLRTRNGGSR
jgi:hypothetical protein